MKGIIDSTLREGAQTTGVHFSLGHKQAIARSLIDIGIEEVEIGTASRFDKELPKLMRFCRSLGTKTSFSVWSLCRKEDIDFAASFTPDVLSLSIPVSDLHIEKKLNKSREWILKTLRRAVDHARKRKLTHISLGLEDATRAESNFLREIIKFAEKIGVFRIRFADTVGIASPTDIHTLIQQATCMSSLEIGIHAHNDFGMATANSLAALEAGGHWADVTVLGLGERTGAARLEEVAGFLALQKGAPYRTDNLLNLCSLVSNAANRPISPHHSLVGRDIFACETGLHLQGLEKDPNTYEPYNPERVGMCRKLFYGSKIGRRNLMKRLGDLRLLLPDEMCIDDILAIVKERTMELGRPLKDRELTALLST